MTMDVKFHQTGIFFDMPEAEYHADPSLSSSGIKDLMVSPLNYWINSPLNPANSEESEDDEEDASNKKKNDVGKAFHAYFLEPDKYDQKVVVKPKKFPTKKECGRTVKEQEEEFKAANADKIIITEKIKRNIALQAKTLADSAEVRDLFTGGKSEVSIFWQDEATGVRMKRRIDYLRPGLIVELKTFANQKSRPPAQEVGRHMAEHHYGIDAHVSLGAVDAMRKINVGDLGKNDPRVFFLFLQKGRVPHVVLREFKSGFNYFGITEMQYRDMVGYYKQCVDRWGYDQPWVEPAELREMEDSDWPSWSFS